MSDGGSARSILVCVPATVGNFGGAGIGAALALDASMNVKVTPRDDGRIRIRYFGEDGDRVPRDSSNLSVQAMRAALSARQRDLTGAGLEVYSSIPVRAGLGASTAAVWAGLIAANSLFDLNLEEELLFALARALESREANLHAAWFGGLAVLAEPGGSYRTALVPEGFELTIVIPLVSTESTFSATACPPTGNAGSHAGAVAGAAAVARFFSRGARNGRLGVDTCIPQHLAEAVPGLEGALKLSVPGLLGTFVCGSGPAVGIVSQNRGSSAVAAARHCFAQNGIPTRSLEFHASISGASERNSIHPVMRQTEAKPLSTLAATGSF
jgi:homoserine kinase